jgi:hypothetical protein
MLCDSIWRWRRLAFVSRSRARPCGCPGIGLFFSLVRCVAVVRYLEERIKANDNANSYFSEVTPVDSQTNGLGAMNKDKRQFVEAVCGRGGLYIRVDLDVEWRWNELASQREGSNWLEDTPLLEERRMKEGGQRMFWTRQEPIVPIDVYPLSLHIKAYVFSYLVAIVVRGLVG